MDKLYITILVVLCTMLFLAAIISKRSGKTLRETLTGKVGIKSTSGRAKLLRERNGSPQDAVVLVSQLIALARKEKMYLIYPGIISYGGKRASLLALLVTRRKIIGISPVGYGGTVTIKDKGNQWTQRLGDETRSIPSPMVKAERFAATAREAMDAVGLEDIPLEIVSVFTCRRVRFEGRLGANCFRAEDFLAHLRANECGGGALTPKEVGIRLKQITEQGKTEGDNSSASENVSQQIA